MDALSTTEVRVLLAASPDSPGVAYYRASVGTQTCEVQAMGTPPFVCDINGLPAGSPQTVQAVACLANAECSSPVMGHGFTLPDGMYARLDARLNGSNFPLNRLALFQLKH